MGNVCKGCVGAVSAGQRGVGSGSVPGKTCGSGVCAGTQNQVPACRRDVVVGRVGKAVGRR